MKWMLLSLFLSSAAFAGDVRVDAHKEADWIKIDAEFSVAVSKELAWQVLVDFEHMPQFLPQLISSHIVSQNGDHLRVSQALSVPLTLFNYHYESVRDIDLKLYREIDAISVGDNGAYKSQSVLKPGSGQTVISYHAEWRPDSAILLSFATDAIRAQIRQQFTQMQQEMLKRRQLQASAPSLQTH
ncbi:MAG: SRPBCC family protein [Iodobacter sp.]